MRASQLVCSLVSCSLWPTRYFTNSDDFISCSSSSSSSSTRSRISHTRKALTKLAIARWVDELNLSARTSSINTSRCCRRSQQLAASTIRLSWVEWEQDKSGRFQFSVFCFVFCLVRFFVHSKKCFCFLLVDPVFFSLSFSLFQFHLPFFSRVLVQLIVVSTHNDEEKKHRAQKACCCSCSFGWQQINYCFFLAFAYDFFALIFFQVFEKNQNQKKKFHDLKKKKTVFSCAKAKNTSTTFERKQTRYDCLGLAEFTWNLLAASVTSFK